MDGWSLAIVFPGQGHLDIRVVEAWERTSPSLFAPAARLGAVDTRRRNAPTEMLGGSSAPPARLELRIHAASVAAFQQFRGRGLTPRALVGHGFGEIAALVAAGAFTVAEGAEIVAARHLALSRSKRRYALASIHASSSKVARVLELVQDAQVSVAVVNSSRHTVIVGPDAAVGRATELARQLGLVAKRLKTSAAPHHGRVRSGAAQMIRELKHLTPRRLQIPVYSPLRRRFFRDDDDLIGCVAHQLVRPLRFADAVRELAADGISLFVECGPLRGLASTLDCASIADTDFDRALAATRETGGVPVFSPAYAESEVA
jgi:acyl transferase domain-containing protein